MESFVEVSFFVVELVDSKDDRNMGSLGVTPLDFSAHINSVLGVDDHKGGVHHAESRDCFTNEVIKARAIYHVDF